MSFEANWKSPSMAYQSSSPYINAGAVPTPPTVPSKTRIIDNPDDLTFYTITFNMNDKSVQSIDIFSDFEMEDSTSVEMHMNGQSYRPVNFSELTRVVTAREILFDINLKHAFDVSKCENKCSFNDMSYQIIEYLDKSNADINDHDDAWFCVITKHITEPSTIFCESSDPAHAIPVYGIFKHLSDAIAYRSKLVRIAYNDAINSYIYANTGEETRSETIYTAQRMLGLLIYKYDDNHFDRANFMADCRKIAPHGPMLTNRLLINSNMFDMIMMDKDTSELYGYKHRYFNATEKSAPDEIHSMWCKSDPLKIPNTPNIFSTLKTKEI